VSGSTAPLTTPPRPNAASTTTRVRSPTDPRRTSPRSDWGPPSAARRRRWPAPHSVLAPPDRRPPPPAPTRPVPDAGDQGPLTMESMRRGRHMAISAAPGHTLVAPRSSRDGHVSTPPHRLHGQRALVAGVRDGPRT